MSEGCHNCKHREKFSSYPLCNACLHSHDTNSVSFWEAAVPCKDDEKVENKKSTLAQQYPHYHKKIPEGVKTVDVYRVLDLFEVTDPCLQHAIKKLLCAGARGAKDMSKDVAEAAVSIRRYQEMRMEEET
jgi:hypothetical protein